MIYIIIYLLSCKWCYKILEFLMSEKIKSKKDSNESKKESNEFKKESNEFKKECNEDLKK